MQISSGVFQSCSDLFCHFYILSGKKEIECGLVWSVLLSTLIRVITVVKICCELTWLHLVSPQHFDHCNDGYRC